MNDEIKLFPYQIEGVEWLKDKRCALLADPMGMGKSAQVIKAADKIKAQRLLVICPAVARVNWLREFEKFASHKRNYKIIEARRDGVPGTSVIVSYDLAAAIDASLFRDFDLIILDEVHYLKNRTAKRTKAILGKKGFIHGQRKDTKIWAISGTPAPNHAGELWPLLYSFGATTLGFNDWIQWCCDVAPSFFGKGLQIKGTKRSRIPEIKQLLAGVMLRRDVSLVGLPKITYSNIVVESSDIDIASESSFAQYCLDKDGIARLEAELKAQTRAVGEAVNAGNVEILKGLAKSVSTLRRYIGCQKVEKVAELVAQELREKQYEKIVIFAIHRDVIEGLRVRLSDFNPVTLYGGTRFDSAYKHIDKFQNYKKFQVFIGNITACGIAINLTAASQVLMIEQEWTPAANAQAIARCHRHGQANPVFVRMVGMADSLDEHIAKILRRKTEELTQIFDTDTNIEHKTFEELMR